jgi:hypothetical protein
MTRVTASGHGDKWPVVNKNKNHQVQTRTFPHKTTVFSMVRVQRDALLSWVIGGSLRNLKLCDDFSNENMYFHHNWIIISLEASSLWTGPTLGLVTEIVWNNSSSIMHLGSIQISCCQGATTDQVLVVKLGKEITFFTTMEWKKSKWIEWYYCEKFVLVWSQACVYVDYHYFLHAETSIIYPPGK